MSGPVGSDPTSDKRKMMDGWIMWSTKRKENVIFFICAECIKREKFVSTHTVKVCQYIFSFSKHKGVKERKLNAVSGDTSVFAVVCC